MTNQTNITAKELSDRMSQRLASFKIGDEAISRLANRVLVDGLSIVKIDPCIYGICIDYYTDRVPKLDNIFREKDIARVEVFPYGIIDWDRFHVRVGFNVAELDGRGVSRGFTS